MITHRIPIVTAVNAGSGIPDDFTDWEISGFRDVRVDRLTDSFGQYMLIPVDGDSLMSKHIIDGDLMLTRRTRDYEDGKIGIWQLPDGGRTAKYAFYEDGCIVLHNDDGWTQHWEANQIHLLGIVDGIERDSPGQI